MDKLTDFKPIKRIDIPGLDNLDCQGLIVIVGPNSSGKSQLLRDIKERISGEPRKLVVASTIEVDTPDHDSFLACLKREGHIFSTWDDNDQEQYVPTTTLLGAGRPGQNIASQQLTQWRSRSAAADTRNRKNEYLGWFSTFFVSVLFLENRLTSLNSVNTIDFAQQAPQHDLHALHLNDNAREALTDESQRAFAKAVWTDISRGSVLCLRVSEQGDVPDAESRHSVRKMGEYRTIETEGDGMKSYVATAISLLLGRRPVSVIDEPELCLHPPQAYNLGQFIGREATSLHTATFVATHSSHILRGVVQTARTLQIVRLTRTKAGFSAKLLNKELLASAMAKPTVRAETVLDGIFSQAVAIVESDGDRTVYQAVWEKIGSQKNFSIHFATVGGTGGISDTCQLYRVLGIPVAVIADLDLMVDLPKLERVLISLTASSEVVRPMLDSARQIAEQIKRLPPTVSEADVKARLVELAGIDYSWARNDDGMLRDTLGGLSSSLSRMRRIKSAGLSALPESISGPLAAFLAELKDVGLFLVPVGELEGWLANAGLVSSKQKKWAWATEAADYVRSHDAEQSDVWDFVNLLGDKLKSQFN